MRFLLLLASFVLLPTLGISATIYVPDNYPTIQGAIDASANGDTVIVRPGSYVENIDFIGKAITVRSEMGPEVTIIDGNQAGSVVTFKSGEGLDSIIAGFTITNGTGTLRPGWNRYYGGGILCFYSSPGILANVISNNTAIDGGGGGVLFYYSTSQFKKNIVRSNQSFGGGGISCDCSSVSMEENVIESNLSAYGGGVWCVEDNSIFYNNIFKGNDGDCGGGLSLNSDCLIVSSNNKYIGNISSGGGGIYCELNSHLISKNDTIINNKSVSIPAEGGGILVRHQSYMEIYNSTIVCNSADQGGGGLCCEGDSSTYILNSILWDNNAPVGPEIWVEDSPYGPSGFVSICYSDVKGGQSSVQVDPNSTLVWGSGMIDADPLFVDSANGDFHLTWDSPCRDTGDNSVVTELFDFEGDPRIVGSTVDMGADEFYYHLYHTGQPIPGGIIDLKVIGYPQAPVTLAWGQTILDPPLSTQHGNLYIWPFVWSGFIGNVSSNGVLSMPVTIPSTWQPGDHAPLQALVGPWGGGWAKLTNLEVVTVE